MGLPDLEKELGELKAEHRLRILPPIEEHQGPYVKIKGHWLLNLSSNDYLGLSERLSLPEIIKEQGLDGFGAGAARLLSGNHVLYQALEEKLSALYGKAALVFSSGYHANIGVIPALCGKKDLVFADKLVHASIIDALRLTHAKFFRFPHQDLDTLERLLRKYRGQFRRAVIVTESLFSMDGDLSPLEDLVALKERYHAFLVLDEAHAIGVYGKRGLGVSEEKELIPKVDLIVGTFGKALGSYGAFVIAEKAIISLLVNKARSFIFTTALPQVIVAANLKALDLLPKLEKERLKLKALAQRFRKELGLDGDSPIVPIVVGENEKALFLAQELFKKGYYVPAIRPPTVPEGTARLRVSLRADITWDGLGPLVAMIKDYAL